MAGMEEKENNPSQIQKCSLRYMSGEGGKVKKHGRKKIGKKRGIGKDRIAGTFTIEGVPGTKGNVYRLVGIDTTNTTKRPNGGVGGGSRPPQLGGPGEETG